MSDEAGHRDGLAGLGEMADAELVALLRESEEARRAQEPASLAFVDAVMAALPPEPATWPARKAAGQPSTRRWSFSLWLLGGSLAAVAAGAALVLAVGSTGTAGAPSVEMAATRPEAPTELGPSIVATPHPAALPAATEPAAPAAVEVAEHLVEIEEMELDSGSVVLENLDELGGAVVIWHFAEQEAEAGRPG